MKTKILFLTFLILCFNSFAGYRLIEGNIYCSDNSCGTIPSDINIGQFAYDATLKRINTSDPAIFDVWVQAGPNPDYCGDNIKKYVFSNGDFSYQDEFECDANTLICSGEPNDSYSGPKYFRDSRGYEFLFYSHGNADFYNGALEFKYRSNSRQEWSNSQTLFKIATENISSCHCWGGIARVAVIEVGQYFYIYFEVWRVGNIIDTQCILNENILCAPPGNSNYCLTAPAVFLARVMKKSDEPYLKIESGGAQIYIKDKYGDNKWVEMSGKTPSPTPEGSLPGPTIPYEYYIFGWGPQYRYPSEVIAYGFYNIAVVNTFGLGDIIKNPNGVYILTSSVSSGDLNASKVYESFDGINFSPESGENIQDFTEVAGFDRSRIQEGFTQPAFYYGGLNSFNLPWYYIAYNTLRLDAYNIPDFGLSYVRIGKVEKFQNELPPPQRRIPRLIGISNLEYLSYYDLDGDGYLDFDILVSQNKIQEVSYEKLFIHGYQEDGYSILVLGVGCHQKKNGKVVCSSEDSDIPGLVIDMENRVIYLKDGYFEEGDVVDLQIILRTWDKDKEKKDDVKKPKKCKNEDKCIMAKIKILK